MLWMSRAEWPLEGTQNMYSGDQLSVFYHQNGYLYSQAINTRKYEKEFLTHRNWL